MSHYGFAALLLPLVLITGFATVVSATEIYRWRDAQGRLHYGEHLPQDADYEQLDESMLPPLHMVPAHTNSGPEKSAQPDTKSTQSSQKKSRAKNRSGVKENPAIQRCRRYKEQLETIQAKLRAGYREPQGNRLRLRRRQLEQRQREEC